MAKMVVIDDIKAAFATNIGARCAADRRILQPDDSRVRMLLYDDREM